MAVYWIVPCVAVIILCPWAAKSQIPTACSDQDSLGNLTCCPNNCGGVQRGVCEDIDLSSSSFDMTSTNVRDNWPHYFTRACSCKDNHAGYDCTRCKYGYYGENCALKQIRSRNSLRELSDAEWEEYINILKKTRTFNSNYKVVLNQYLPGTRDIKMANIDLYDLFVWLHHFAAKDSDCPRNNPDDSGCTYSDYAHSATGFPTWHRQYLLWFEWEIQEMIHVLEPDNLKYHEFRIHYWDWRKEIQEKTLTEEPGTDTDVIFRRNRLGVSVRNENNQSEVVGDLVSEGWDTICWYGGSGGVDIPLGTVCNPSNKTGPLLRCPYLPSPSLDPCRIGNPDWPTQDHIDEALRRPVYDTTNYETDTTNRSFRSYMEGYDNGITVEECGNSGLCACDNGPDCGEGAGSPLQRRLHNSIHIAVGIGDFTTGLPGNMKGVMADNAASPNDPLFPHHHSMVDCVLEEWLKNHSSAMYPDVPASLKGHQREGYIIPFFPLFKHEDMFRTGDNFGYSCMLSTPTRSSAVMAKPFNWLMLVGAIGALVSLMNI